MKCRKPFHDDSPLPRWCEYLWVRSIDQRSEWNVNSQFVGGSPQLPPRYFSTRAVDHQLSQKMWPNLRASAVGLDIRLPYQRPFFDAQITEYLNEPIDSTARPSESRPIEVAAA